MSNDAYSNPVFDRIRSIYAKFCYYICTLIESYQKRGIEGPVYEVRKHIWWRWYRTRMHPRWRGFYAAWLQFGRLLFPSRFTDADPFKIIYVDPTTIEHRELTLPAVWGRVIGGNWAFEPFEADPTYNAVKERVVDGKQWTEIDHDIDDIDVWETLYRSMQQDGYKSQETLAKSDTTTDLSWDCEVGVAINGNGDVVWVKRGSHRVRMARLLQIDTIPVHVRVRHPEWQALRDEIRTAESVEELSVRASKQLGHPDLYDVGRELLKQRESETR